MRNKIKYWLELSEDNLKTAEAMVTSQRYRYVGFMAHQAIEKILKAYLVQIKNQIAPFSYILEQKFHL